MLPFCNLLYRLRASTSAFSLSQQGWSTTIAKTRHVFWTYTKRSANFINSIKIPLTTLLSALLPCLDINGKQWLAPLTVMAQACWQLFGSSKQSLPLAAAAGYPAVEFIAITALKAIYPSQTHGNSWHRCPITLAFFVALSNGWNYRTTHPENGH
jgi:hypothetical protein